MTASSNNNPLHVLSSSSEPQSSPVCVYPTVSKGGKKFVYPRRRSSLSSTSSSSEFSLPRSKFSLQKACSLPSLQVHNRDDFLQSKSHRRRYQRRGSRSASMFQSASICAAEELAATILKKRYSFPKEQAASMHARFQQSEHAATSTANHDDDDDDVSISSHSSGSGALAVLTEALKLSEFKGKSKPSSSA